MRDFLPFIVSGIASGAVFGLCGTGLVLTYKTSGIFNFGHGAIATVAAYVFYWLHIDQRGRLAAGGDPERVRPRTARGPDVRAHRRPARRAAHSPARSSGRSASCWSCRRWRRSSTAARRCASRSTCRGGTESFEVAGVVVTYDKVIITAITVVAVAALYALFRFARIGVAMRAVVDDPDLLAMQATNPAGVRRVAWVIGATFAALSGVLVAPIIGVDAIVLTFLVVKAFGAAAVGGVLEHPADVPRRCAHRHRLGHLEEVRAQHARGWPGSPRRCRSSCCSSCCSCCRGAGWSRRSRAEARPALQYRSPGRVRLAAGLAVLVPLALVPDLVGAKLPFFTVALVTVVMLLSLGLLVRTSGQVSLCHATFAAIGAVAFSQLHVEHGVPWVLALVLGGLVAVPVGALVAVPAIRLSGLYLALATLGFGILVQRLLYGQSWMFTAAGGGPADAQALVRRQPRGVLPRGAGRGRPDRGRGGGRPAQPTRAAPAGHVRLADRGHRHGPVDQRLQGDRVLLVGVPRRRGRRPARGGPGLRGRAATRSSSRSAR